jgi:hypothetical protein
MFANHSAVGGTWASLWNSGAVSARALVVGADRRAGRAAGNLGTELMAWARRPGGDICRIGDPRPPAGARGDRGGSALASARRSAPEPHRVIESERGLNTKGRNPSAQFTVAPPAPAVRRRSGDIGRLDRDRFEAESLSRRDLILILGLYSAAGPQFRCARCVSDRAFLAGSASVSSNCSRSRPQLRSR